MRSVPLVGPSYNLDSRPASVQRTINLMPVPLEPGNERTAWVLKDVPGLVEVVDNCVPPVASFDLDPAEGFIPFTVDFTDTSTGTGVVTWLWDFGDGATSTEQNPSHEYTEAGTYTVTLTVGGSCGSDMQATVDAVEAGVDFTVIGSSGTGASPTFPPDYSIEAGDYIQLWVLHRNTAVVPVMDLAGWKDNTLFSTGPISASTRLSVLARTADGTGDDALMDFSVSGVPDADNVWAVTVVRGSDARWPALFQTPGDYEVGADVGGGGVSSQAITKPNVGDHVVFTAFAILAPNPGGAVIGAQPNGYTLLMTEHVLLFSDAYRSEFGLAYKLISGTNTEDPGIWDDGNGSYGGGSYDAITFGIEYTP